jgi:hypothetical protein
LTLLPQPYNYLSLTIISASETLALKNLQSPIFNLQFSMPLKAPPEAPEGPYFWPFESVDAENVPIRPYLFITV